MTLPIWPFESLTHRLYDLRRATDMCGIFGIIAKPASGFSATVLQRVTQEIFHLSETRGKDASGALVVLPDRIMVVKSAQRVSYLIAQPEFEQLMASAKDAYEAEAAFAVAGHSRMVTNGTEHEHLNNQPVIKDGHLILHNGIIVNDADLWCLNPSLQRQYQVDTEIFGALLGAGARQGQTLRVSMQAAFVPIKGGNTIAAVRLDEDQMVIGTSNGSMYFWQTMDEGPIVFASERLIAERAAKRLQAQGKAVSVQQLKPGRALAVDLANARLATFSLTDVQPMHVTVNATQARQLVQVPLRHGAKMKAPALSNKLVDIGRLMRIDQAAIRQITRCTQCLLPETFPFISFDTNGVCQVCRRHQPRQLRGVGALKRLADKARRGNGYPDCLVPISGGRDSCYGLHYVKKELGLNPVAYTYDWGFVTDLARRNISRMCGSLGVEHVLVAADIRQKRENVRKNVTAWLKNPALGMIPLFMAGDKMYFYYASLIRRQMELGPVLFSMNWLEKTGFKTGFANINDIQDIDSRVHGKTYSLSVGHKIELLVYYGRQFLTNSEYLNGSIPDTLFAFFSYYLRRKDYDSIFDYLPWDEQIIERTIIEGYEWETSPDTVSTWRIGDGTAPFYNYIYLAVAGFSEHDTFRSNQIREGLITREKALSLIEEENQPRVESFKWYCDIVGIDAVEALKAINQIPKLYPH
jgi:hypothetical protein